MPKKITIDTSRCKGCLLCVKYCPKNCLGVSDIPDAHGINVVKLIDESACISCRNCELICPESCIKVKKK